MKGGEILLKLHLLIFLSATLYTFPLSKLKYSKIYLNCHSSKKYYNEIVKTINGTSPVSLLTQVTRKGLLPWFYTSEVMFIKHPVKKVIFSITDSCIVLGFACALEPS